MTETKMHSFLRHGVHLHVLIFEQIKMDGWIYWCCCCCSYKCSYNVGPWFTEAKQL